MQERRDEERVSREAAAQRSEVQAEFQAQRGREALVARREAAAAEYFAREAANPQKQQPGGAESTEETVFAQNPHYEGSRTEGRAIRAQQVAREPAAHAMPSTQFAHAHAAAAAPSSTEGGTRYGRRAGSREGGARAQQSHAQPHIPGLEDAGYPGPARHHQPETRVVRHGRRASGDEAMNVSPRAEASNINQYCAPDVSAERRQMTHTSVRMHAPPGGHSSFSLFG